MFKTEPVNLDRLRIFAALLVTAAHARSLTFEDFISVQNKSPLNIVFYWLTSLGHPSVLFFFVLSGYLVGGGIIISALESRFVFSKTLFNRLSRIWLVLIPSLILTYILNYSGCNNFTNSDYCKGNLPHNLSGAPILTLHNFSLFLKTSLFLVKPDENSDFYGGNRVLWSLQYEISAYFTAILLATIISILLFLRKNAWLWAPARTFSTLLGLLSLCVWLYLQNLNFEFLLYFLMFALGIASRLNRFLPKIFNRIPINTWTFLLSLIFFGELIRMFPIKRLTGRVSISDLLFSIFIAALISNSEILKQRISFQNVKFLSMNFSFSLYVTHFPLQGLIASAYANPDMTLQIRFIVFLQLLIFPIILARLFAFVTEDRTYIFRNFLTKRISSK